MPPRPHQLQAASLLTVQGMWIQLGCYKGKTVSHYTIFKENSVDLIHTVFFLNEGIF